MTLEANIANVSYLWSTGESTASIIVSQPGTYTVSVTDSNACSATKTITLNQIDVPAIEEIISDEYDIIVVTSNMGSFEFSLDGFTYQSEPVFRNIVGGSYTVYIRNNSNCDVVTQQYIHFVSPKFFTPNGDGYNDTFEIGGIESYTTYEICIFDRYGKLLEQVVNTPLRWDGEYNNRPLPSADYWYTIRVNEELIKGHFALKR